MVISAGGDAGCAALGGSVFKLGTYFARRMEPVELGGFQSRLSGNLRRAQTGVAERRKVPHGFPFTK